MAETKEGDEESMNASDVSIETQTKLIDVIQSIEKYKYMPKSRLSKWDRILADEELVYLADLMIVSRLALQHKQHKFSTCLYGVLEDIKRNICGIKLRIVTAPLSGAIPVKTIEGCYIDTGYKVHGRRAFVKVQEGIALDDTMIIYVLSNCDQFAIQKAKHSPKNWCWIRSNEKASDQLLSGNMTWEYYRTDTKSMEAIKLSIKPL